MANKFNIGGLITGLNGILAHVQQLAPIATSLGLPAVVANVATIAIAATGVIQNILERGANMKDALSEQDETKLRAMLADLQTVNDQLAGVIGEDSAAVASGEPSSEVEGTKDT